MADYYGDAELVVGQYARTLSRPAKVFTKWYPADLRPGSLNEAAAAVELALARTGQTKIALMQYHIWDYTNLLSYLPSLAHLRTLQSQGKIGLLGVTDTDAAHLELLLHSGIPIATNQVSVSVLDRRLTRGSLASLCKTHGVGVLAYGVLLGGFLSDKWLGVPQPQDTESLSPSLQKYLRFIHAAGGWARFQNLLSVLNVVAQKHGVSIAAVGIRWVLDIDVVKAVVVGCKLDENSQQQAGANLAAFSIVLGPDDRELIATAQGMLKDIPGDCGDERRRPPFLTASGNMADHVRPDFKAALMVEKALAEGRRIEYRSGSQWENIAVCE